MDGAVSPFDGVVAGAVPFEEPPENSEPNGFGGGVWNALAGCGGAGGDTDWVLAGGITDTEGVGF